MSLGIYIHIPFCVKKCNYCDFNSFSGVNNLIDQYVGALIKEIDAFSSYEDIDTIFFGGGTPTIIGENNLEKIMVALTRRFRLDPQAEISIETNPGIGIDFLALHGMGFNRLSVGLQSVHDNELKILGRIHAFSDFEKTYTVARKYFNNINIDLMYGIPEQTFDSWKETVNKVVEFAPEHISAYALKIEEKTPFYDMNLTLPDEDAEREMYYYMVEQSKYQRYEISNFARDEKYYCKHNLKYWNCEEYIGFGLGAHSYYQGKRYNNTENLKEYIKNPLVREKIENLSSEDKEKERIILGLRLDSGVVIEDHQEELNFCVDNGLMEQNDGKMCLTKRGIDISNQVFVMFI